MTNVYGQDWWTIDFEDTAYINRITIDTISNPNNIWQIGKPSKIIMNSAYSPAQAIITDTFNYYPINDTSKFIIRHIRPGYWGANTSLLLDFYFKINTDSINDYGIIEVSIDNGINWINLLTEDTTFGFNWLSPKPTLTGNSNGWVHFSEDIAWLTFSVGYSDTLLYRFTFISDSIQTNKEGWVLDNFMFNDWWEGIEDLKNDDIISVFPNPTSDQLSIKSNFASRKPIIQIFNFAGQKIYESKLFKDVTIDTKHLDNGIYLLKYSDNKDYSSKKFIVYH